MGSGTIQKNVVGEYNLFANDCILVLFMFYPVPQLLCVFFGCCQLKSVQLVHWLYTVNEHRLSGKLVKLW